MAPIAARERGGDTWRVRRAFRRTRRRPGRGIRSPLRLEHAVRPEFLGRGADPLEPRLQHRGRGRPGILQGEERHLGHGVDVELEGRRRRRSSPAPAPTRPEQVRVVALVARRSSPSGVDEVRPRARCRRSFRSVARTRRCRHPARVPRCPRWGTNRPAAVGSSRRARCRRRSAARPRRRSRCCRRVRSDARAKRLTSMTKPSQLEYAA